LTAPAFKKNMASQTQACLDVIISKIAGRIKIALIRAVSIRIVRIPRAAMARSGASSQGASVGTSFPERGLAFADGMNFCTRRRLGCPTPEKPFGAFSGCYYAA
jgi:hypothetical protein